MLSLLRIFTLVALGRSISGTDPGTICSTLISDTVLASVEKTILEEPVAIFGIDNVRCTVAAVDRLESLSICFHEQTFEMGDALWDYFKCKHPDEGYLGQQMHSYIYIGGSFVGNGFALLGDSSDTRFKPGTSAIEDDDLIGMVTDAQGSTTCAKDCAALVSDEKLNTLNNAIASSPVVLYGWSGCPCTKIAEDRFKAAAVCFVEYVWPEPDNDVFKYLQCVNGIEHHSFIWFGGEFVGDGFGFAEDAKSADILAGMISAADARTTCVEQGESALSGDTMQSCTQSGDGQTTGWLRTGSCNWDPSDGGYHEVCVTMSDEFLESSAQDDGNDLRSVVQSGGHWCICAWAFASAVMHDPENLQGIVLSCDRTNDRLREVYEHYIEEGTTLRSPSGRSYEADVALAKINEICGDPSLSADNAVANVANAADVIPAEATTPRTLTAFEWELQVTDNWQGASETTVAAAARENLFSEYGTVFPHNNRNAASHRWSTYVLQRSQQMTQDRFEFLFRSFCAVSGSPIGDSDNNRYSVSLDLARGSGSYEGYMYYCCSPCFCDTQDEFKVDTRSVTFADGSTQQYHFVVIGDPCGNPSALTDEYNDAFGRGITSVAAQAPDVTCNTDGVLEKGTRSDGGYIIMGMVFGAETAHWGDISGAQAASSGLEEMGEYCEGRAEHGFNSGMGAIFRKVAEASPISSANGMVGVSMSAFDSQTDDELVGEMSEGSKTSGRSSSSGDGTLVWALPLAGVVLAGALVVTGLGFVIKQRLSRPMERHGVSMNWAQ